MAGETKRTERAPDYVERYSNNITFDLDAVDLTVIFGTRDYRPDVGVLQHTAMRFAWPEVKMLHFFLGQQIATYEAIEGKIAVPNALRPSAPQEPTGDLATNKYSQEIYKRAKALYDAFIESL